MNTNYTAVQSKHYHRMRAENERLRAALERIAVFYRGGEKSTESMLEMRAIARRALLTELTDRRRNGNDMKGTKAAKTKPARAGTRGAACSALAAAVWEAAKKHECLYEDVIGACAILTASVSKNTGEPLDYLISEIARRSAPNEKAER